MMVGLLDILMDAQGTLPMLESLDRDLLLMINGSDSLYLDRVAHVLTTALTWIPLYISLFVIVLRNNDSFPKVLMILAAAGLCVLLAGTVVQSNPPHARSWLPFQPEHTNSPAHIGVSAASLYSISPCSIEIKLFCTITILPSVMSSGTVKVSVLPEMVYSSSDRMP